jgi:hypothetical protein
LEILGVNLTRKAKKGNTLAGGNQICISNFDLRIDERKSDSGGWEFCS